MRVKENGCWLSPLLGIRRVQGRRDHQNQQEAHANKTPNRNYFQMVYRLDFVLLHYVSLCQLFIFHWIFVIFISDDVCSK